jgi:ElaB/YqjD/DUF883 family membrane-anchored ribosome-binding protein
MYEKTKDAPWEGAKTTTNATVNRIVNEKVADADILKTQTAEALEDAARKLRMADVSAQGEHVKQILQDVEDRVNQFKKEAGVKYDEMEAGFHKNMEPVETMITDHPIPAILVAIGVGVLAGMLIRK